VDAEPLTALLPDQPPEPVHAVALADVQFSVAAAPLFTVLGAAERLTVGAGVLTETVVDCVALPPVPVQTNTYVAFAVSAPVDAEPLVAFAPDQAPEAVQEVALVDDHVRLDVPPWATVLGLADSATVGAGLVTDTVAD
jgi:hypothetical protein